MKPDLSPAFIPSEKKHFLKLIDGTKKPFTWISFSYSYWKTALAILLVITTFSCKRDLDINPPFEGEKLVVNAFISSEEGIMAHISHTTNPVGEFLESKPRNVEDARVLLFEENTLIAELQHQENGNYILPLDDGFVPVAGKKYRIEAKSNKYGEAKSSEVLFPEAVTISYVGLEKISAEPGSGSSIKRGLLSLCLNLNQNQTQFFYLHIHSDEEDMLYYSHYDEFMYNFSDRCMVDSRYGMVFSTECGLSSIDTLRYVFDLQYSQSLEGQTQYPYYENLRLSVITVGEEFFEYMGSMNHFIDIEADMGLLFGVPEPSITQSNISGGYGLFYALSPLTINLPEIPTEEGESK